MSYQRIKTALTATRVPVPLSRELTRAGFDHFTSAAILRSVQEVVDRYGEMFDTPMGFYVPCIGEVLVHAPFLDEEFPWVSLGRILVLSEHDRDVAPGLRAVVSETGDVVTGYRAVRGNYNGRLGGVGATVTLSMPLPGNGADGRDEQFQLYLRYEDLLEREDRVSLEEKTLETADQYYMAIYGLTRTGMRDHNARIRPLGPVQDKLAELQKKMDELLAELPEGLDPSPTHYDGPEVDFGSAPE